MLDQICYKIRIHLKHYSIRTERTYFHWIKRFTLFPNKHSPAKWDAAEVEPHLRHLAGEGYVATSIQNQALAALLVFYREVLGVRLPPRIDESSKFSTYCWNRGYMPNVCQGWRQ
jgi:hypothetical protein